LFDRLSEIYTKHDVGSVVSHMVTMKSYGLGVMGIVMAGTMLSALVFRKGAYQKTSTVINVATKHVYDRLQLK